MVLLSPESEKCHITPTLAAPFLIQKTCHELFCNVLMFNIYTCERVGVKNTFCWLREMVCSRGSMTCHDTDEYNLGLQHLIVLFQESICSVSMKNFFWESCILIKTKSQYIHLWSTIVSLLRFFFQILTLNCSFWGDKLQKRESQRGSTAGTLWHS